MVWKTNFSNGCCWPEEVQLKLTGGVNNKRKLSAKIIAVIHCFICNLNLLIHDHGDYKIVLMKQFKYWVLRTLKWTCSKIIRQLWIIYLLTSANKSKILQITKGIKTCKKFHRLVPNFLRGGPLQNINLTLFCLK